MQRRRRGDEREWIEREHCDARTEEGEPSPPGRSRPDRLRSLEACAVTSGEEIDERRKQQDERRVRRHHHPEDARVIDTCLRVGRLRHDEGGEPAADDEKRRQRAAGQADEAGNDEPLDDAQAPEVLLDREQIQVEPVPVELDVVVQWVVGQELLVHAGGESLRACGVEERQVPETAVFPERKRDERRRDARHEEGGADNAAAVEEAEREPAEERRASRLDRDGDACGEPGGDRLDGVGPFDHAQAEIDGDEHGDHRGEVGHRGQPETLRQRR